MTDDLPLWAIQHAPLHGEPTSLDAAISMVGVAAQQCRGFVKRQSNNVGIGTGDPIDQSRGTALDGIAAATGS